MKLDFVEKLGIAGALAILCAFISLLTGWCLNLYALVMAASHGMVDNWALFIIRIIGVFVFPVGGVAGYF